jgi:hypothetical protein
MVGSVGRPPSGRTQDFDWSRHTNNSRIVVARSEAETDQRSPRNSVRSCRAFRRRRHFDACVIDCVRLCVQRTDYFYGLTSKLLNAGEISSPERSTPSPPRPTQARAHDARSVPIVFLVVISLCERLWECTFITHCESEISWGWAEQCHPREKSHPRVALSDSIHTSLPSDLMA